MFGNRFLLILALFCGYSGVFADHELERPEGASQEEVAADGHDQADGPELSEEEIMRYIQTLQAQASEQEDEGEQFVDPNQEMTRGFEQLQSKTAKTPAKPAFSFGDRLAFSAIAGLVGLTVSTLLKNNFKKSLQASGAQDKLDSYFKKDQFIASNVPGVFLNLAVLAMAYGSTAATWQLTSIANKYIEQNKKIVMEIAEEKFTKSIANKLVPNEKVFEFAQKIGKTKSLDIANKILAQIKLNIDILTQASQASSTTDPSIIAEKEILEEKAKTLDARIQIIKTMPTKT